MILGNVLLPTTLFAAGVCRPSTSALPISATAVIVAPGRSAWTARR
jgi:hypothetical protein